ncbi:MAG: glycosyltransferase [Inquilinaceae bacterium]
MTLAKSGTMCRRNYDVVLAADLRFPGGTSTAVAAEIEAQASVGYRTGLLHVSGPILKAARRYNVKIRALLDAGKAELLDPQEQIGSRLLVLHHPMLFTHLPARRPSVVADNVLLVVHHPPFDGDGSANYDWRRIDDNIASLFGAGVRWAPVGPAVRRQLESIEGGPPLLDRDWTAVMDMSLWAEERVSVQGSVPVVGRHSRPDPMKWPDDSETILAAYPNDPNIQVRILGGGDYLESLVGPYPDNWNVQEFDAVPVTSFLSGIDFFVYFHSDRWVEAFGITIMEAMAAGAIPILPRHFEPALGDAAIYAEPKEVKDIVLRLHRDPDLYARHASRVQSAARELFGWDVHISRLRDMIGAPSPSAGPPRTAAQQDRPPRRVLFISSNGVGMGHLARLLAIARRCRAPFQPVFLTMSQGMAVVEEFGFLAEYRPFWKALGCETDAWNRMLRRELNEVLGFYDPVCVVFDGNVPYQGLIDARQDHPHRWFVWSRRGMWREGAGANHLKREKYFDAVIEPEDIAGSLDVGGTVEKRSRTLDVPPVHLLDASEILPRLEACDALGLDTDRTNVLLQLGSGNNFDNTPIRDLAIAYLLGQDDVSVACAEWVMADQPHGLPESVRILRKFPLARYFRAFDFAISAAGYNSYHDLIQLGVPTLFVPNEHPMMDDQLARAVFAERHGIGMKVRVGDVYQLDACLKRLLQEDERAAISGRCKRFTRMNGALDAAQIIEEMAFAVRAERDF